MLTAAKIQFLPFGNRRIANAISGDGPPLVAAAWWVNHFVLCTVERPDHALAEIARVLRPGGQLLFIERVRAETPALPWWQDRLLGPWRRFACGCRCNRATVELMRACGFDVTASKGAWRAMPPIVRPLVSGRAQLSGACP